VVIGLVVAVAAGRAFTAFLYDVSPFDAATFIGVPLVLMAVTLLACWLPARRATKVDPIIALRAE